VAKRLLSADDSHGVAHRYMDLISPTTESDWFGGLAEVSAETILGAAPLGFKGAGFCDLPMPISK
jgi:hypothetical protein